MSGLDKIIEKINSDSEAACGKIIADANAKAQDIAAKAQTDAQSAREEIIAEAEKKAESILKMSEANCRQQSRRAALAAKVAAVDEIISAANDMLCSMETDEYFAALTALAIKNAEAGEGIMLLNSADISRLPDGFIAKINAALPSGSSVSLSDSAADIKNGFILVYGDIEINCTFDALIEANRDAVKEKICSIIF